MAIQKHIEQQFSPEHARTHIVKGLAHLSPEALNEVATFVAFLHFREGATGTSQTETVQSAVKTDAGISAFAGMLSAPPPGEMRWFDDALRRRPLCV